MNVGGTKYADFEQVRALRVQLEDLITRQKNIVTELALESVVGRWDGELAALEQRVRSDTFKVLVLGQFNRGKSTFINALIGRQILPSYATPTTAVINEVKYGDEPRIVLYPRPRDGDQDPPVPIEVPVDQLEQHVVVDDEDIDRPNPYIRAEVYWPLELCRNGVEIIDSPGLNEDRLREQQTLDYLGRADAVVMLLDANQPATADERDFYVEVIEPLGHDDIFWVFNRINLVDARERDRVEAHARKVLKPCIKFDQRIYFVDAKGALDARVSGDEDALIESNLRLVERNLEGFLARQRGRSKVLVPTHQLQRSVREVGVAVAGERALLDSTVDDLEEAYRRNQAPLDRLRARVGLLTRNLDHELERTLRSVSGRSEEFLSGLTASVSTLTNEATISKPEDLVNPLKVKAVAKELTQEVTESVTTALTNECTKWVGTVLIKSLTDELEKIRQDISADVAEFEQELHGVRLDLSAVGRSLPDVSSSEDADGVMAIRPPVGAFVGYQLGVGAVGGAMMGGMSAVGLSVVTAVVGIGGALVLPVVAAVAAVALVAVAFGAGQRKELAKMIRQQVAKSLTEQWRPQAELIQKQIMVDVQKLLDEMQSGFKRELTGQIAVVEEQATAALAEMNQGQEEVQARKGVLDELKGRLDLVERDIDTVIDLVDRLGTGAPALNA